MRQLFLFTIFIWSVVTALSQVTVQMKREGGVSFVPCKVNGLKLNFIFDTGASEVSISMTEATFMLKNDYLSKDDIVGTANYMDANGNINAGVKIILKEIEIGGLKLTNVKASVVNNMKAPLLLGQSAISKLGAVQLDLIANTLTILNTKETATVQENVQQDVTTDTLTTIGEPDTIDQIFKEADEHFAQGNFQQAVAIINLLLAEKPKHTDALTLRALSHDNLGDFKSAIADYNRVIAIEPKNGIAYCYRGKSKHDLKNYSGALADLNQGLLLNDKYTPGFSWRAETKQKMNNLAGALLDYNKAIALSPQDSSIILNRALLKLEMKDYTGAVVDCNKVLNINDEYAAAYYCRGRAKRGLKQYTSAIADLNKAIDVDPEFSSAYAERGSMKELIYEDLDGALEDYNKALELDPDYLYASILKSLLEDKIKKNVWISAGSSNQGDKWYIYNSTISKDYSTIKIWIKNDFKSTVIRKNGRPITLVNGNSLWLCVFNCSAQEYKVLSIKHYDSKGTMISEYNDGAYEDYETVAPGTVMEMVLNRVCEKYNK